MVVMFGFVKKIVNNSFEKPKLLLAILLVLLPVLLELSLKILLGITLDTTRSGFVALTEIVLWIVSGISLYVIIYLFKGNQVKGKLGGILTALSYGRLIWSIAFIFFFAIAFFMIPEYFLALKEGKNSTDRIADTQLLLDSIQGKNEALLLAGFGLILIIAIVVTFVTAVLIPYNIISLSTTEKSKRNLFAYIVYVIFLLAIGLFI